MGTIKVQELAKELNIRSSDIAELVRKTNGRELSPADELTADEEKMIRSRAANRKPASSGTSKSSPDTSKAQQPVRKKKNISVVFNRSGDDRRRTGGPRPPLNGAKRPASQDGSSANRPRKTSRRLMESEREQMEQQRAQENRERENAAAGKPADVQNAQQADAADTKKPQAAQNAQEVQNVQAAQNAQTVQNTQAAHASAQINTAAADQSAAERQTAAATQAEQVKAAETKTQAQEQAAAQKTQEPEPIRASAGQSVREASSRTAAQDAGAQPAAKSAVQNTQKNSPRTQAQQGERQPSGQPRRNVNRPNPEEAQQPKRSTAAAAAQTAQGARSDAQQQETAPVKRKNILADLQRQEEERKKAAAARKQQQKNRSERPKESRQDGSRNGEDRSSRKDSSSGRENTRNNSSRDSRNNSRSRDNTNRSSDSRQRAQQSREGGTKQGSKSVVFNNDSGSSAKSSSRKGQDNKKQQQGDYKKDKRRGTRLDKSEKSFSLEKQSSHKKQHKTPQHVNEAGEEIRTITIPDSLTLKELADLMKVAPNALVKKLLLAGKMMTLNQELSFEDAEEIALEYNCIAEREEKVDLIEELLREEEENEADMVTRPPVVCVMGHVDHGKTSLLDAIRHTHHIDTEAGGITQAIGAYVVEVGDRKITFLDTPGHEAFTAMRMRGANSTDIAVLVVAADDGVMPQTVEAINHAKAAGIDLIVAINKIDKPGANIDRVKQELSEYQLIPEDWGGNTVFCNISAKTGEGIDDLLEMILLSADVLELKANPDRPARGLVIESRLDKGKGVVATVLVQKGTLKIGQPIAAGASYGRVRAMTDEDGHPIKSAGPSVPAEIQGLSTVPNAGEIFVALPSEKEARAFAETFISEGRNKLLAETKSRMSLDDLFDQIKAGSVKELNIIIKADVQGSAEAIKTSLLKLSNDEVAVKIIHSGVGAINESDVVLATASNALIIGFNVAPDASAKSTAESEKVEIKLYDVIYNAIDDVERAMKGMLDPVYEEKITGHAQIRVIYKASGVGNIAGSYVLDGVVQRDSKVRLLRDEEVLFEGEIASLKRYKDDVKEVKAGFECGIVINGFDKIAEDDIIEAYTMVEVPRT